MEEDLLPVCEENNVSILPYFPLESGFLTGKIKRGMDPEKGTRLALWKGAFTSDEWFNLIDEVEKFGNEINRSLLGNFSCMGCKKEDGCIGSRRCNIS